MPQLHLVAVLQGLKRLVNRSGNDRPVGEPSAPRTRPAVPGRALSAIRRLDSVLRYRAGRLVPKAGRPQTVVILARKRR